MQLDEGVLRCLQIISQERHPNMHSSITVKECLSLYGIMNKPKSIFGRRLFDINFKRPLCDVFLINQRLDLVEYFVERVDLSRNIENLFKGLGNIKVSDGDNDNDNDLPHTMYYHLDDFETSYSILQQLSRFPSNL
jgi:DNA mismatch repair ATPase MutS